MNEITGKSLIAGNWIAEDLQPVFTAFAPLENQPLELTFTNATTENVTQACLAAENAFTLFGNASAKVRARLLTTISEQIMALGQELIETTHNETGLPLARLEGERGRTVNQLNAFANLLLNPIEAEISDEADSTRQPLPKPATVLKYLPLGPVAVFGASNFPYAFSTAGGDTASALAAGCPVVVKGHPAHPATSELIAKAISRAIDMCDLPQGIFSLLQSSDPCISHQLVQEPAIKAVGFTGSFAVAKLLQQSINQREEMIPLYGELGSVNPQVILKGKVESDSQLMAESLTQSLMMGNGQFCTSPGLWFVPENDHGFIEHLKAFVGEQSSATLLTQGIGGAFDKGVEQISQLKGVSNIALGNRAANFHANICINRVDAEDFLNEPALQEEIFGPFALVVTYKSEAQLLTCIQQLKGQLTASVHGTEADLRQSKELSMSLAHRVGRLIFNQMPTGVEVCHSMNHGGPYPASTDVRSTSVGSFAIKRYQRPICYQNMPSYLLA